MFNKSIDRGMMPTTRLSTAAVVQVVQPRFDPPQTTNVSTLALPPSGLPRKVVIVSIARTALLVIGKRNGQRVSPLFMNLAQGKAMIASSVRFWPSPANTSGWLGTIRSSAVTLLVAIAILAQASSMPLGAGLLLFPPVMYMSAVE